MSNVTKKTGLLGLFLMGVIWVNAQSVGNNPGWVISKEVQKIANKKMLEDEAKRGSQLQAKSISQLWVISKGVNRPAGEETSKNGNVMSKGIPAWTISKGVHQRSNR